MNNLFHSQTQRKSQRIGVDILSLLMKTPGTLRQLLTAFTLHGLREAQAVAADLPLTEEEIAAQAVEGRVKFAERYGQNNDTPDRALQVMLRAFADGWCASSLMRAK